MTSQITRLYPLPSAGLDLPGLYLAHNIRQYAEPGRSFVYTNYVTSLDGRISVPGPDGGESVPEAIANDRDWRLFQELAVQADVLITSGRYLREYEAGKSQEILRIYDDPRFTDLKDWREARGLPPMPALAVISGSLDFPIPENLSNSERTLMVFTMEAADPGRAGRLNDQTGGNLFTAGEETVDGKLMVNILAALGCRTIYNATGPKVNHLLVQAGVLDRLYLTLAGRLLGGSPYSTILEGSLLDPPPSLTLNTLYLDPHAPEGAGQLLASYNIRK